MLSSSVVLSGIAHSREFFDPANPVHLASLKSFVNTGNWGEVQFYPELPYTNVPMTVFTKFAKHALEQK